MSFRFSLAWSSLFVLLEPAKAGLIPISSWSRPVTPEAKKVLPRVEAPAADRPKAAPASRGNWEMVVPRMARPPARPESGTTRPLPQTASFPKLYTASDPLLSQPGRAVSFGIKLLFGVVAVAALTAPVWLRSPSPLPPMVEVASTMGEGGWMRERASSDPGSRLGRQLIVYRPSLGAADSRLEFTWRVNEKGVGWVFRATDVNNYYAARIKVLSPGPSPTLAVEHYTVYQGVESAHSEKALAFSRSVPALSVRMEVAGPSFTLYLQGNASEYWTDTRLTTGALGFFEERNQPAEVQSLRISFSKATQSSGGV